VQQVASAGLITWFDAVDLVAVALLERDGTRAQIPDLGDQAFRPRVPAAGDELRADELACVHPAVFIHGGHACFVLP
jgi:hypothetical protein